MENSEQSTSGGTQAKTISEVTKNLEQADFKEANTPQEIAELEKLGKFKLDGREWTSEQIKKSLMLHADYTKKTQEVAQERKYGENLKHDLENVRNNPELVHEFKKIYPEKYHGYLDVLGIDFEPKQAKQASLDGIPKEVLDRINRVEAYVKEKEISVAEAKLDQTFAKLSTQYPSADEEAVIARAQILLDRGEELTNELWEKLYKENHTKFEAMLEKRQQEKLNKTKQSARQAKDTRSGGGALGEAPKKQSFKEATEQAIRDLGGR